MFEILTIGQPGDIGMPRYSQSPRISGRSPCRSTMCLSAFLKST